METLNTYYIQVWILSTYFFRIWKNFVDCFPS
nr:MAG TPA: hypothetical protein [Caudoviricetes sp.]